MLENETFPQQIPLTQEKPITLPFNRKYQQSNNFMSFSRPSSSVPISRCTSNNNKNNQSKFNRKSRYSFNLNSTCCSFNNNITTANIRKRKLSEKNKIDDSNQDKKEIIKSIKKIMENNINTRINSISNIANFVINNNTKENRKQLIKVLLELHPLFNKIHPIIVEYIVLLSKLKIHEKYEYIEPTLPHTKYKKYPKLGFTLCGSFTLTNPKINFCHNLEKLGTIFENYYIENTLKSNEYITNVIEEGIILWLDKESYELIREQCFIKMDLKFEFGALESLLTRELINKRLNKNMKLF